MVIIRKNGRLNSITAGLAEGLQAGFGMGQTARRTQLAEQAHADEVARAEKQYNLELDQNRRAEEDQKAQRQRESDVRDSSQAASEYAAQQPITQEFGQGAGVFADLQSAQNAELSRTAEIAKRIKTPEAQQWFIREQRAKLEDQQNQALIEHNKTRLQKLLASPMHSDGGELGHKGEERAARLKELSDLLEQATTPEARAKAVDLVGKGLQTQIVDDAVEADRLRTVARNKATAEQDMARRQQTIDTLMQDPTVSPEVLADMQAGLDAMGTTLAFYEAANGEMTPQQFSQAWQMARRAKAPRLAAGSGAGDNKAQELDARIRKDAADFATKEFAAQTGEGADKLPYESLFAKHYKMLGGRGDQERKEAAGHGMDPFRPLAPEADGALGKTMFDPGAFRSQIQGLIDSGRGREAREAFKKAGLGTQFNQTDKQGEDGILTDSKVLMRNRNRARAK